MKKLAPILLLLASCAVDLGGGYTLPEVSLSKSTINPPDSMTCTMDFTGSPAVPAKASCTVHHKTAFEWASCTTTVPTSGSIFSCPLEFGPTYIPTGAAHTSGTWTIAYISAFNNAGSGRLKATRADLVADGYTDAQLDFTLSNGDAGISNVWAQSGETKITQDVTGAEFVSNVWNGASVMLDGMRNEVVSFTTMIEADTNPTSTVNVTMTNLTGPGTITYKSDRADLFSWAGANDTDVELFYVRYIPVTGISAFHYLDILVYEDAAPASMQSVGGTNLWADRPGADKAFPDIAVPLELENGFTIAAGENQQIWADIYIPRDAQAGEYTGTLTVTEQGRTPIDVPVTLTVHPETMPDTPSAVPAFAYIEPAFVQWKHLGIANVGSTDDTYINNYFQVAHRHRIDLIGADNAREPANVTSPWRATQLDRLDGDLFTEAQGYAGPGLNYGVHTHAIGPQGGQNWYGPWCTDSGEGSCTRPSQVTQTAAQYYADEWAAYEATVDADVFVYLDDEPPVGKKCDLNRYQPSGSDCVVNADCVIDIGGAGGAGGFADYGDCVDYGAIYDNWGTWMTAQGLDSFITKGAQYTSEIPNVHILAGPVAWTQTAGWGTLQSDAETLAAQGRAYGYNGVRPLIGSAAPEDDGVALREAMWAMYKLGINKYWIWSVNYWMDSNTYGFWNGTRGNYASQGVRDPFVDAWTIGERKVDDCQGVCANDGVTPCSHKMQCTSGECGSYPTSACDFNGTGDGTCENGYCKDEQWGFKSTALYGVGSNGDGLLMYPGNDFDGDFAAENSYGVGGPLVSLRMKHWRRGVQDLEYIAMAAANEQATEGNTDSTDAIVAAAVPKAWWEATNLGGYGNEAQSWSSDPNLWDNYRKVALLSIIREGGGGGVDPTGLVAQYDFTEGATLVDSSGNGNTATNNGAVWVANGREAGNGAYDFTSGSVYLSVSKTPFDLTGNLTVAAWVNAAVTQPAWAYIAGKGEGGWGLERSGTLSGEGNFGLTIGSTYNVSTVPINDGLWHHIAGVFDDAADTVVMYVDGVPQTPIPQTATIAPNPTTFEIGRNNGYNPGTFNGLIDDVRVYNRALTDSEVGSLAGLGPCVPFTCGAAPRECGSPPDGCGSTLSCGSCGAGETCYPEGTCCTIATCNGTTDCGAAMDDTCGGTIDCSSNDCSGVDPSAVCYQDQCCVPDCAGKECGDDGCGGSCGTCSEPNPYCDNGTCTTTPTFTRCNASQDTGTWYENVIQPTANNTGPSDEATVGDNVVKGTLTIGTDETYENYTINGCIKFTGSNGTIRNFRVTYTDACDNFYPVSFRGPSGSSGNLLEDGEVNASGGNAIVGEGYTARRLYVHNLEDAFLPCSGTIPSVNGPTLVECSYVEDVGKSSSSHANWVQCSGLENSSGQVTMRYNHVLMGYNHPDDPWTTWPGTAMQITAPSNRGPTLIEKNWINHGGWVAYMANCSAGMSSVTTIKNNLIGNAASLNTSVQLNPCTGTGTWTGNIWACDGSSFDADLGTYVPPTTCTGGGNPTNTITVWP